MSAGNPETLTVLRARGRRLAKLLHPSGHTDGYDNAKHLDGFTVAVMDLAALLKLLQRLLPRPDCCVVRGELLAGERAEGIRRLLYVDGKTGDQPTMRDVPRRWLALDIEGVLLPAGVQPSDLAGCAAAALAAFPPTFHGAACVVQASASHGLKPDLCLRVWVWLDRPTWGHELKRWLNGTPADASVFGAVQPIYTAAPALAPGMIDPMPRRLLPLPGHPVVNVPAPELLVPPPRIDRQPNRAAPVTPMPTGAYMRSALARAAHRISTTQPPGRHRVIVGETSRLARFVGPGLLTARVIADVVREAARLAGKDDEAEVSAAIAWGLANPWTQGPVPEARHGR